MDLSSSYSVLSHFGRQSSDHMSSIKRSGAKTSLDKIEGIEKVATMGSFKSLALQPSIHPAKICSL